MPKLLVLTTTLFCSVWTIGAEIQFSERFTLENVFAMPESAVIDESGDYIYISNVNAYAKDGNGFISRVRTDGSELELHWLDGLDSPTGLAIRNGTLFLADYDQLVEVDITAGQITNRFPSPDIDPALNDVAIAPDGEVFVTGSGSRTIYWLNINKLEVWLEDRELFQFANGLLGTETEVIHGGQRWTVFNRENKQATNRLQSVNSALTDIDGITGSGCDGFFVTTVSSDQLWIIDSAGEVTASMLGAVGGIDLHRHGELLAVPRVGNSMTVYEIDARC
ncbi:MAG: hypothetical protein GKR91_19350 [Pseudomonadales bacterium]|nr:hypothetical protein [Pseudomonadales bacterium]